MKRTLTDQDKLKLKSDFMLVREKGKKQTGAFAILLYLPASAEYADRARCGIICSRKFDRRAVRRNRARRLLHESFRLMKQRIAPCQMIFIPRRGILNAKMQDVAAEMEVMFSKARLLRDFPI